MLDRLDATAVHHWCAAGLDALRQHQREIDDLNVYPVPDGDTGTNLVLTVAAAHEALAEWDGAASAGPQAPDPAGGCGPALRRMARGALLGARGNSGVIISQIFTGMADALAEAHEVTGRPLARALREAEVAAYAAVAEPVEGTVLSVARAAADAAAKTGSDDLVAVARAATLGAAEALARTPEQLPALARAGVVDAGGRGLVVLLDALLAVTTGTVAESVPPRTRTATPIPVARESGSEDFAYEVQYLLDAPAATIEKLRDKLSRFGDSLVVVGAGAGPDGSRIWNVHVHVNDVGLAIEAAIEAGRPHRISVTRFADMPSFVSEPPPVPHLTQARRPVAERGAVVVATGIGLERLFAEEGATVVPGPSPSTADLLEAIRGCHASRVVLLPNDPDGYPVASAAAARARAEGIGAGVVPTRSPVQALAALAVRDPTRRFEDDMIAMAEAAGACRYADVATAAREAVTVAGMCQAGDILGLVEGEVNLIGKDLATTCRDLLDRLLAGGGELVTLLVGAQAPDDLAPMLTGHLAKSWPFVEVQVFPGGQPHYPLLVGVE